MKSLVGETKRRNCGRQGDSAGLILELLVFAVGRRERIEVGRSKIRNAMNLVAQENEQTDDVEMVSRRREKIRMRERERLLFLCLRRTWRLR